MLNVRLRALAVLAAALTLFTAGGFAFAGGNHVPCNAGRGNGSETPYGGVAADGQPNDCDPGRSAGVNHGGDYGPVLPPPS